jgi:hypothetical protein
MDWVTWVLIFVMVAAYFVFLYTLVKNAPLGYEDENGFHLGDKK